MLREEDARIEKVQAGTWKRRRGARPAANLERNHHAEEDVHMQVTITMATHGSTGKRKIPHVAQEAS